MKKKFFVLVSILLLFSVSCIGFLKEVKADNNVTINYHISTAPDTAGNTLVIVNMTIKNNGYSNVGIFYGDFQLNESGDQYPSTPLTAAVYLDTLPSDNLKNGALLAVQ